MPEFFIYAEEIAEEEQEAEKARLEAEKERIQILNITPLVFDNPREALRKQKAAKRKQQKIIFDIYVPEWFLNPNNEVDYYELYENLMKERKDKADLIEAQRLRELHEAEKLEAELASKNAVLAKQKTNEMQRKALKVICGLAPKRARAPIRRRK